MYNAAVVQWSTQRSKKPSLIGCGFESHQPHMKKQSKYKITDNLYRCECGKEFNKSQSLNAHFSHCDYHHECLGTIRKKHYTELHHTIGWELSKSTGEIKEILLKSRKTLKEKYNSGKLTPPFLGKHHSEEFKNHLRELRSQQLKDKNMNLNYSKKACEYINKLNEKNNWHLQHAENDGEVLCLGYWLDGYDKNLNIVFEYDEPKHYIDKENNILRDYDIKHQTRIIEKLKCEFWRYNEYLNLLYRVN